MGDKKPGYYPTAGQGTGYPLEVQAHQPPPGYPAAASSPEYTGNTSYDSNYAYGNGYTSSNQYQQQDVVLNMGKPDTSNIQDGPATPQYNGASRPGLGTTAPPRPGAAPVIIPGNVDLGDESVRRGFVRKVLLIVAIQLLITTGISVLFYTYDPLKSFVSARPWTLWVVMIAAFAILFSITCCPSNAVRFPLNYFLLFSFTVLFSMVVGAITAQYDTDAVAIALGVTAGTVVGAFLVATFTKLDLTKYGGFLLAVLVGVLVLSVIAIFIRAKWFHFAIALVSAILFTAYLIYDLQLVMGGRRMAFHPDHYVIAALNIYIDIIQIFLNVLRIIGLVSD